MNIKELESLANEFTATSNKLHEVRATISTAVREMDQSLLGLEDPSESDEITGRNAYLLDQIEQAFAPLLNITEDIETAFNEATFNYK